MASPFAKFRKNQKVMMVILTVLAMFAFVVLPNFIDFGQKTSAPNPDVVSTRYGVLRETDLHNLGQRRMLANQFINNARQRANMGMVGNIFGGTQESELVSSMIFARKAEELGFYISDNQIIAFLDELTNKTIDGEGFAQIAQERGVQESEIMEALRYEMTVLQFPRNYLVGTQVQTPAGRWEMYQSLNREVSVEMIPLPVETFVGRVSKADETTLRAFFEQHKFAEATFHEIEPGFKQPHRVAFQYFKIKAEDFASQVTITEDEIVAAYERDKDVLYRYRPDASSFNNPFTLPGTNEDAGLPVDDVAPEAVTDPAPVTETEFPPTYTPAAKGAPAHPDAPAATDKSTPPTDAPATDAAPAAAPIGEKPAEAPQSSVRRSPFKLASYRLQDAAPAEGDPVAEPPVTPTNTDAVADPATPEAAADTPPAAEGTAATTTDAAPPLTDDEPLANEDLLPPGELQDGPDPTYEPLWKVREQVRKSIADEKARPLMEKVTAELSREMRLYESKWKGWNAQRVQKKDLPAPKPLDFDDLARKSGVETRKTSLLASDALLFSEEHTLGKSYVGETPSEATAIFNSAYQGSPLFQPQQSQDVQGNHYLFWKIDEKDAYIPTFEEVRGDVEEAWNRQEARKLAVVEANKLADEARKSGKPLNEAFANRADLPVTTPRAFTWKFGGFMFGQQEIPIRTSQVEGVEEAGDDFMRTAYGLNIGEIGVAMNETKTAAYLMRLVNTTPDANVLHTMFLATPYGAYGRAGEGDALRRQALWRQELNVQANVQWLRAPQDLMQ